MKKNSGYEINYIENTIDVTKSFLKEAGTIGSAAYTQLAQLHKDLPDFQIIPREISKKQGKQTYGNLTYKVMEEFITAKEEDNATVVLAEFKRVQTLSKIQSGSYAFVKTWFLKRYKEEFEHAETEEQIEEAEA